MDPVSHSLLNGENLDLTQVSQTHGLSEKDQIAYDYITVNRLYS
jgi:hypothetical protein